MRAPWLLALLTIACSGPQHDEPPARMAPAPSPGGAASAEPVLTVAAPAPAADHLKEQAGKDLQEARGCLANVDRDGIPDAENERIAIVQGLVDAAERALAQDRIQEGAQLAAKAVTMARDLRPKQ